MGQRKKKNIDVYKIVVDPATGKEVRILDPTAQSIQCSQKNIKEWVKKGLIPKDLGKFAIKQAKETQNRSRNWAKLLKKGAPKEEVDGYLLEWAKKEQLSPEDSKKSIELIRILVETKNKLLETLSIIGSSTFRQSQEIIDNKLTTEPTTRQTKQLPLLDLMEDAHTEDVVHEDTKKEKTKPLIKGLSSITEAEDKLLLVLSQILSKRSENYDQKSPNYYMGNYGKGLISANEIEMETARIRISPHELYSTYTGRNNYNTDHIQFILNTLKNLSKKNFLITINVPSKKPSGKGKRFDKLRIHVPLFEVGILNLDISESESQKIDKNELLLEGKRCQLLFRFGPIFTNNIRDRYVEFPEDIHIRIAKASGSRGRVPQCINLLRDLIFREKQKKRYTIKRDEEKLIHILDLTNELKARQRGRIQGYLNKGFKIFQEIGLLKSVEKIKGARGQPQYVIEINKDFK